MPMPSLIVASRPRRARGVRRRSSVPSELIPAAVASEFVPVSSELIMYGSDFGWVGVRRHPLAPIRLHIVHCAAPKSIGQILTAFSIKFRVRSRTRIIYHAVAGDCAPASRPARGVRSIVPQLEQAPRVGAADLEPVVLADGAGIEPVGGVIDVLEWPVGGEHDAVGADFQHGVHQRLGAEIA